MRWWRPFFYFGECVFFFYCFVLAQNGLQISISIFYFIYRFFIEILIQVKASIWVESVETRIAIVRFPQQANECWWIPRQCLLRLAL
jgi:hypothetical protein